MRLGRLLHLMLLLVFRWAERSSIGYKSAGEYISSWLDNFFHQDRVACVCDKVACGQEVKATIIEVKYSRLFTLTA